MDVSFGHRLRNVEDSQFSRVLEDLNVSNNVSESKVELPEVSGTFENLKIPVDTSAAKIHDLHLLECPIQTVELTRKIDMCKVQHLHLTGVQIFDLTCNFGMGQV